MNYRQTRTRKMGILQRLKARVWKFITWTPADLFYSIPGPPSAGAYAVFHSKILCSNLKYLFINIILIGVFMDTLFLIHILLPHWETETPNARRLYTFIFTSALNFTYHLVFLLLRKKTSVRKYRNLISAVSLIILYYFTHQYLLLFHMHPPVPLWSAIGLLQTLVAVHYCQGSFVCSMFVWICSSLWVSSADSVNFNQQVCRHDNNSYTT